MDMNVMSEQNVRYVNVESGRIPLTVEACKHSLSLVEWIADNLELINEKLKIFGSILFRDFDISEQTFPQVMRHLCGKPLEYMYRSTPRTSVGADVYTATEYPAHQVIPQHNENAYTQDWPMKLAFFCECPAEEGGETPLAESTRVTARISPHIVDRFAERRVKYVRNYGSGLDLLWQNVFQTEEKEVVEEYCRTHDIQYEWLANGCLRTSEVCQAVAEHPLTGQRLWFNQAHLFHISSLGDKVQKALLSVYKQEELPRNVYYGDGSPIEPEVLEQIRNAYRSETVSFRWKRNDVMLLDNMLVSHGRNAFKGKRRVLVSMGQAYSEVGNSRTLRSEPTK
jgi:alpha-ketoglutarate-dependent taurine dioxygenase